MCPMSVAGVARIVSLLAAAVFLSLGPGAAPVIAQDDHTVLYFGMKKTAGSAYDLYMAAPDPLQPNARLVPMEDRAGDQHSPVLSPDGRHLLYFNNGDLWELDQSTGTRQELINLAIPEDWHPLENRFLYRNYKYCDEGIYEAFFDIGPAGEVTISSTRLIYHPTGYPSASARYSPNGPQIVFSHTTSSCGGGFRHAEIFRASLEGPLPMQFADLCRVTNNDAGAIWDGATTWSTDGQKIFWSRPTEGILWVDAEDPNLCDGPTEHTLITLGGDVTRPVASPPASYHGEFVLATHDYLSGAIILVDSSGHQGLIDLGESDRPIGIAWGRDFSHTIYVDAGTSSSPEDGTSERPYDTIQEAINDPRASSGTADNPAKVLVAKGTYNEALNITGKPYLQFEGEWNNAGGIWSRDSVVVESLATIVAQSGGARAIVISSSDGAAFDGFFVKTSTPNGNQDSLTVDVVDSDLVRFSECHIRHEMMSGDANSGYFQHGIAISSSDSFKILDSHVYHTCAQGSAVRIVGSAEAEIGFNHIFSSAGTLWAATGIAANGGSVDIHHNSIYSEGDYIHAAGISIGTLDAATVINNTIHVRENAYTAYGIILGLSSNARVANNVMYLEGLERIGLRGLPDNTNPTSFSYNDVWGPGGAVLYRKWIAADTWYDVVDVAELNDFTFATGNISADPLFVHLDGIPENSDYHLQSEAGHYDPGPPPSWPPDPATSPCIDAGDPAYDHHNEAEPNGWRINMGRYGNTAEASKSPVGVAVISPNGGEGWELSLEPPGVPRTETISWMMSANARFCQVEVKLLYWNEMTDAWSVVPPGGGLPAVIGPGGACSEPGVQATSLTYTVPTTPPSGTSGSLYKIRVTVTDHAGRVAADDSDHPFFFFEPPPPTIETLILTNTARMRDLAGADPAALLATLQSLANHSRVHGRVVDLAVYSNLTDLYYDWDTGPASQAAANAVLFAEGGVHDVILNLLDTYTEVKYLILVGDDRIIPLARFADQTKLFPESEYTKQGADLTPEGTTVGRALAADKYLSDDPLASRQLVRPIDLDNDSILFTPDLYVGRLVEDAQDVSTVVAAFLSQDGVLDLMELDSQSGHKVLVTGYHFLLDVAKKIRAEWNKALSDFADPVAPVDGVPVGDDWSEEDLLTHLCGNDGPPYRISSLNGHATHYELGVPGIYPAGQYHGLGSEQLVEPAACDGNPLRLTGNLVYSVGCHEGLPVAGSTDPADNPLDVPEGMAQLGVVAHLANTGYGWGLKCGLGYSQMMVLLFTEELIHNRAITVGQAVYEAKSRYFAESPRIDVYDLKTSRQWRLTGIPNLVINIGTSSSGPAPSYPEASGVEQTGLVTVERRLSASSPADSSPGAQLDSTLPPEMTLQELSFGFTADGVYSKHRASGELEHRAGCPPPDPADQQTCNGCYYTLNDFPPTDEPGRATGEADLPIQPFFFFESHISGVVQQGVLWTGGTYEQEEDWVPIFGTLTSNGEIEPDIAVLPRRIYIKPRGRRRGPPRKSFSESCLPVEPRDETIVITTAELEDDDDPSSTLAYSILKLHREVDLEVFYLPESQDGPCDPSGPDFGVPTYGDHFHDVAGTTVLWKVPVTDDDSGVWRVVVVYDAGPDAQGHGAWIPLELSDGGTGTWTGELQLLGSSKLTYYLQAVDTRGNVSWRMYVTDIPDSGIPLEVPWPADVALTGAEFTLDPADDPDPVETNSLLAITVGVSNLGPEPAENVTVSCQLPAESEFGSAIGPGWTCAEAESLVTCNRSSLAPGAASTIGIYLTSPPQAGTIESHVSATAANAGAVEATEQTLVIVPDMTDLAVVKEGPGSVENPGPITYWITVTNNGPLPAVQATVIDSFPPELDSVVWDCVASPGSSCTAQGLGAIGDSVDLAVGGRVIYAATGTVSNCPSPLLRNTVTVAPPDSVIDYNPDNNSSTVSTACNLTFADGFESGDCSAWSNSPARILLRDKVPSDKLRFVGRFVLDPEEYRLGTSETLVLTLIDEASGRPLALLGLARQDGGWELIGEVTWNGGSAVESRAIELAAGKHGIEIERLWEKGRESFLMRIDDVTEWQASDSQ